LVGKSMTPSLQEGVIVGCGILVALIVGALALRTRELPPETRRTRIGHVRRGCSVMSVTTKRPHRP